MKIETLEWEKAEIEYQAAVQGRNGMTLKAETLECVTVAFESDGMLHLRARRPLPEGRTLSLIRPKLVRMLPWEMVWEASWWTARVASKGYDRVVPARITLTF